MTDTRPLNVKVAEALGFQVRDDSRYGCRCYCVGQAIVDGPFPLPHDRAPHNHIEWKYFREYSYVEDGDDAGDWEPVPPYGDDSTEGWACTGPLVDVYVSELGHRPAAHTERQWYAVSRGVNPAMPGLESGTGRHAPAAVAKLILILAESGRLPK
jgi:hypothetical protein